ncbi:hypothetical protein ES288_A01G222300v1 [Gossypium darwinii]|uniref:DUF4218 domain-containing protein n=1 Tax=Gossypium darwinii TaxID=34276 RepID=A0A5D2HPF0_GOSDA|nr:hypothetical protein ES288_A01G222300v1 [Gossypium darwinii]
MYPIERYLIGLKASVQNRAYPEGSIAEGNDGNIQKRYIFSSEGRPIGTMTTKILDMRSLAQANRYVLLHSDKLSPYRQEFLETDKRTEDKWLVEKFSTWLAK